MRNTHAILSSTDFLEQVHCLLAHIFTDMWSAGQVTIGIKDISPCGKFLLIIHVFYLKVTVHANEMQDRHHEDLTF